jgi:hypothetical protein
MTNPDKFNVAWFITRAAPLPVWLIFAGWAWWRKRWMLCTGTLLAGVILAPLAYQYAGGELPRWLYVVAGVVPLPVAMAIFGSFIARQDRGRPDAWTP